MPQHFDPQHHADMMAKAQNQTPEQRSRAMAVAARNVSQPKFATKSIEVTVGLRELRVLGVVDEAHTRGYSSDTDYHVRLKVGVDYPKDLLGRPSRGKVLAAFAFFFVAGWLIGAFG